MIRFLIYIFLLFFSFTSSVNARYSNAINRGKTGAGIFSLKNFGNENTNIKTATEWLNENRENLANGSLGLLSDVYNSINKNGEGEPQVATATGCSLGGPVGCAIGAGIDWTINWVMVGQIAIGVGATGVVLYNLSNNNSSGQEPENMNNNDNNGGDKDPNSWCAKHSKLCLDFDKLSPQDKKSIKTYEKRIQEHKEKLEKFKKDPTVKPGMENRSPNEIRLQQERRIKHLQHEIDVFEENIKKILGGK